MKHPIFFFIVLCILLLTICNSNNAQFFSAGNEPSSVKWQCIETKKFKLIFPTGLYSEASRLAQYIERSYPALQNSMTGPSKRIPIILHNQNVLSNGFVTWAPKRMEIFTTPSRDFSSQDWLENLALHEYRHVLQIYSQNKGFTKFLTCLTGQTGIGLPVSQIPLWLNEGDAVIAETIFSESGRGRLPVFEMPFKACILHNEKDFSYDKLYFGSYKHFVPDYYKLGFYLASFARLKYGKDIWNRSIDHVGKFSFVPFSLHLGLNHLYNTSQKRIFNETIDTLKLLWNKQYNELNLTKYSNIPIPRTEKYTNYRYAHPCKDSSIIAFKSSIDDLNCIVKIDHSGRETILHIPGLVSENRLTYGTDLIVWDEIEADLRWEQRNYSVIKSYQLSDGKVRSLTIKSRAFSPCLTKDDKKIALIKIDTKNTCSLVIIDAATGVELFHRTAPEPGLLNFPVWYGSDRIIATLTTHNQGKLIYSLDLTTGEWVKLTDPTFESISQITVWKDYLLFSAGFSGIDNIYALNIKSKELFQVTSARYGAFDPLTDDSSDLLYYSQYTGFGFRPAKIKLLKDSWILFKDLQYSKLNWSSQLAQQEIAVYPIEIEKDTAFESKHYSRFANLLNIHSWMPFYFDTQFAEFTDLKIKPGFTILSQNNLSSFISSVGLSYENKTFLFRPSFIFSGFFPVLDFSATIGGPGKQHILPADVVPKDTTFPFLKYTLNSYIPLRFFNNKYHKLLQPEIDLEYENTLFYDKGIRKGIMFIHYKFLMYRYLMLSYRDIYPKWGQLFKLTFSHTPFEKSQYGILTSGSGTFYFPGFFNHQSLICYSGFQYRETGQRRYFYPVNRISMPRGYSFVMNEPLARMLTKFSANYGLPLSYPDLSIGDVAYIKRIRANAFIDYSYGYDVLHLIENQLQYFSENYFSFGMDMISDLHLFRFYFPFSLGLRVSYIPHYGKVYPEFLLSIDTSAF
jgi:hypothetical protein